MVLVIDERGLHWRPEQRKLAWVDDGWKHFDQVGCGMAHDWNGRALNSGKGKKTWRPG